MGGFGLAAAQAAIRLDRVAPIWFAFGAILGPNALLLLRAAPPGRCRSCSTPTRGWHTICLWCGEQVTAIPLAAVARAPILPTPSIGRDWLKRRDQATPIDQIPRAQSAAPISTPAPETRHVEPLAPPAAQASNPAEGIEPAPIETRILTTAVYVSGSRSLESGRRYIIAIHGPRLRVLGPVDIDPSAVALDRALADMDATADEGRLVVSGPGGKSGTVLVFMSVARTTPDIVANAIVDAARTAAKT